MSQEIKNNDNIILFHHLGLGDHLMCHGIVREYCKKYKKVAIFCWPQNYTSVSFMFKDLKNLLIIRSDEKQAREMIAKNFSSDQPEFGSVKIIGYEYLDRNCGVCLEKQFYEIAKVDFNKKWDSFHIERNLETEKKIYNRIAPPNEYAFVHEDKSRGFGINRSYIGKGLEILTTKRETTDNIFDYCTVLEKAKEIHVIDSCFMFLVDCLDYNNPKQKLYIHRYARYNPKWKLPVLKKKWHVYQFENYRMGFIKYLKWKFYETVINSVKK